MIEQAQRQYLIHQLLAENARYQQIDIPEGKHAQERLLRSLMNVRPPMPIDEVFLQTQDAYLSAKVREKGIVSLADLSPIQGNLYLWQGDITRLAVDAIVNAANNAMLGCFIPCHGCIDNAIHSLAGVQLRLACDAIMQAQGHHEPTGHAKITPAFNLPCNFILHTVGPIVSGALTQKERDLLANCYRACLTLAIEQGLQSIAFCCISTGEFCFPNAQACQIAVQTVQDVLRESQSDIKVIFNVFTDQDAQLYAKRLGQ